MKKQIGWAVVGKFSNEWYLIFHTKIGAVDCCKEYTKHTHRVVKVTITRARGK